MPSTYSPDLRIELISNGEQSGTWGTTTNNNLGTLIENAISGLATVAISSTDQALTAVNGASDQARCAAIELTGGSAAFNLFVPPVTKLYVIKNSTSYAASVYCSTVIGNTTAAGAGMSVPAGKTTLLRADGTDVFDQVDHLASLSLDTPLAASFGGTGASTASGARSNLGATTIGDNLFTLADPSAVTFPRFNADNSVSALSAADFRTAITAVTSVAASSPVASSGGLTPTISLAASYGDTQNPYASKTANYVLAAPSGSAGAPSFRALVAADLPGFTGSLATNGYQMLPSGLMIQWGTYTSTNDSPQTFTWTHAFPTGCFAAVTNFKNEFNYPAPAINSVSATNFTVNRDDAVDGSQPFFILAIGY